MADETKKVPMSAGLPQMPEEIILAPPKKVVDWKRIFFILLGFRNFLSLLYDTRFAGRQGPGGESFHA